MLIRGRRQAINVQGRIQIMDTDLHEVDVTTFIGVDIDKHLTWKSYIAKIKLCIRKEVGILYRLRNFVPRNILILLYQTFMQPHITYGIEVWGGAREVDLNSILLIKKMAIRAITFST